ncbi:glutathione-S-transferase theta, GST [Aspergillus eucalypticola CBS 122712]|uniref:Glutathione-S-transferase theta, GST n=1 Tax=Aspergillus eucalypticola (strain CBS 122712 / IBT 29274) TaxID=1448314 RepID=A0A317W3T0_ASPEC|nr:glutathione-S-transferase theta, GST [Aspergillus eucalypticola CBS 122712]PWY79942.1 glutathione-S-transferase theta, GST [Aspergillus eucalypticola CBS 122712]
MTSPFTSTTPPRIKNTKGLHLLTASTPNGKKVQILLEELSAKYGLQWTTTLIDLETDEQKQPWFLALNPNGKLGKIPLLIDNSPSLSSPLTVMESSPLYSFYLIETYDPDHHFHFSSSPIYKSQLFQWLFFWSASGQPQQAGLNHLKRFAGVVDSYAIENFKAETLRIYNVLELHLSNSLAGDGVEAREYLVGEGRGKYSIADINAYTWIRAWKRMTITEEEMGRFPLLRRWVERIEGRPAVGRGVGEGERSTG